MYQQPPNQPPQDWQQPYQPYPQWQPQPQKKPRGDDRFNRWLKRQSKLTQVGIGCGIPLLVLFLCVMTCSGLYALGTHTPQSQSAAITSTSPTTQTTKTSVPTHTATAKPTPKTQPTSKPTVAIAQVTPTPKPQPTLPPPPKPTPTPPTGVNGNPWGYNFVPGNLIYSPNSGFCGYFTCVSTFWTDTNGYVVECVNGSYSHSGGVRGACSRDGGVERPLYSH